MSCVQFRDKIGQITGMIYNGDYKMKLVFRNKRQVIIILFIGLIAAGFVRFMGGQTIVGVIKAAVWQVKGKTEVSCGSAIVKISMPWFPIKVKEGMISITRIPKPMNGFWGIITIRNKAVSLSDLEERRFIKTIENDSVETQSVRKMEISKKTAYTVKHTYLTGKNKGKSFEIISMPENNLSIYLIDILSNDDSPYKFLERIILK
jgi:hypothetical protein